MDHSVMTDHGLMQGMLWGSLLMMSVPILLGIGIGTYALRRWLEDRRRAATDAGQRGPEPPHTGDDDDGGGLGPWRPGPDPDGGDRRRTLPQVAEPVGGGVSGAG